MSLPIKDYAYYCGIDPGHKGAFGVMNAAGTSVSASTMPMANGEIDLAGLAQIFKHLARLPDCFVAIEWPEAFPGSFGGNPRDNDRFGRQKGYLEAMAHLIVGPDRYCRVPPTQWKGRLGLDGKTWEHANDRAANLFRMYYPDSHSLIVGPRGGLLDGPLDALLIAHFVRTRGSVGMKSIATRFGKDSVEAMAFILGGARRKRKSGRKVGDL